MEDHALILRLQSEEPECSRALKELFSRYARPMIHYARRFTGDRETAEDIVQNVFLSIWRNRHSLRIEKDFKAYLFTAVRNQALKVMRQSRSAQEAEITIKLISAPSASAIDPVEYEQLQLAVRHAIGRLPGHCKQIFLMSRLDGLTYRQIAAILGISVKTVETQMGRALKHLRESIF